MELLAAVFLARLTDPVTAIVAVGLAAWLPRWWGLLLAGGAGGVVAIAIGGLHTVRLSADEVLAIESLAPAGPSIVSETVLPGGAVRRIDATGQISLCPPGGGCLIEQAGAPVFSTPERRARVERWEALRDASRAAAVARRDAEVFAAFAAAFAWALGIAALRWSLRKKPV